MFGDFSKKMVKMNNLNVNNFHGLPIGIIGNMKFLFFTQGGGK